MVPDKSNEIWMELLRGNINHQFKVFSVGMLLSRLNREMLLNPEKDPAKYVDALHAFFCKYERLLTDDIDVIFR